MFSGRYRHLVAFAIGLGLLGLLASACGEDKEVIVEKIVEVEVAPEPPESFDLVFWWWGEEELPGWERWLKDTAEIYEARNPHIDIKLVRQTVESLTPTAIAAAAAREGPDLQFFWASGWMLDSMWNGDLAPLDDLIPEVLDDIVPVQKAYASWRGETFSAPLYNVGMYWTYNKLLFEQAGLDPDNPPQTWDEFLAAGDALNAIGITPIAFGLQDQWLVDLPWMMIQAQGLNTTQEWYDAYLGSGAKLDDPEYVETWTRIQELIDNDFFVDEVMSIPSYVGWDLFPQGKAAMVMSGESAIEQWARSMGRDNIGVMLTPRFTDGALGTKQPLGIHYISVTQWSDHKQAAADFIALMHESERMRAQYDITGAIMGSTRFEREWLKPGLDEDRYDLTFVKGSAFGLWFIGPPVIDDWLYPAGGSIFTGDMTPAEAAKLGQETMERWRDANPEAVENFREWLATRQ